MAVGASAALATIPRGAFAAASDLSFPAGFKWGAATAAFQIEGSVNADGRGQSIWDVFSRTPGKIADNSNGDVAADSYRRYREDTALLKNLGAHAYRFSIAWPRIFPTGRGKPNRRGIDHYKRVVDNLLESGVEPYVTLYHWDLPSALKGGWQSRDTAYAFADYAGYVAGQLSDRVTNFITTNEMRAFVEGGHLGGIHAPGLRLPAAQVNQVRHHALLAQGLGVQAIRARARAGTQIGIAENPVVPIPAIEDAAHIAATKAVMRSQNYGYLTAVLEGRYDDAYLSSMAANAPIIQEGDMAAIGSALDFVSMNIYAPNMYVSVDANAPNGYRIVSIPASYPRMTLPWIHVGPEVLYWAVRLTSEIWNPRAIFISENGTSAGDRFSNGRVDDVDRVMYLRNYLTQLRRAAVEEYPIKGYFVWTLLDNFEWAEGYTKRFGIHHVDFETQRRTPKLSAHWYREVIRRNAVV